MTNILKGHNDTIKKFIVGAGLTTLVVLGAMFLGQNKNILVFSLITNQKDVEMDMEAMRIIDTKVAKYSQDLRTEFYAEKVVMLSPLPDSTK